jgi:autotransporter-associated beta strand protein
MSITNGTLQLAHPLALQNSTLNYAGGSVNFSGITAATLGGLSGGQNLPLVNGASGAVTLTVGSNSLPTAYSGGMSGTGGSLIKVGAGTLTLTGTNNYSGSTTVDAGTVEIPAGGVINGGALGGGGFLVDGGTVISAGTTSFNPVGNAFLESAGAATFGSVTQPNNDGLLIKITGGSFSTASLTLQRTAQFLTAPTATAPIAAATTSGLYVNGATANVNLGALTIGAGNSSDSVRLDSGTVTVTNEVLVGHTSNTRWEILQVNGGNFNALDTVNGVVLSQNNGGTANNSEVYVSGGTLTAGKIAFGAVTDTVGGNGFLIVSGGALYLGSGGIVQPNTAGFVSTISLTNGSLGAVADWSSTLPMQLSGTNFTIRAADATGTAHNISLAAPLVGGGGLTKTGVGTLTLAGNNTYTGASTVVAGTLLVNGRLSGSGAVTITNGGTLGGTGIISGPVAVNAGGTLAPGNPLGTLIISNSLALTTGGAIMFQVQHSPLTNSALQVTGTFTNGGKLFVNGDTLTLAAGDTFKLWNATAYSGAFSQLVLPVLRVGYGWDTSRLNSSGTIAIVVTATPVINTFSLAGTNLIWSGTGGVGSGNFFLLGATNIATPLSNWTRLLTNQFDTSGNFDFTNPPDTNGPPNFYRLQVP